MTERRVAVAYDAGDPEAVSRFWAALLDREAVSDARGVLLAGSATQVALRFVASESQRVGADRIHLHLTSADLADQQRLVQRVLELGGSHLDVGQLPEEGHVVLADPEGNALCVIEPDNAYLAGCGPLGELACDGTRAVGLFWQQATGWPLVWDQDEETAIQSPAGGTKVAWGGPPVAPRAGRNRQRLELVVDDVAAEVARLVSLGATPLVASEAAPSDVDLAEVADPDGNEVVVTSA